VPPRHGNKYWCVAFWEPLEPISALDLFATGNPEIIVKAFDSNRASQPEKPVWSYLGYGNSSWYRVKVLRRVAQTVPLYQFQHPVTQRDADLATSSGWMSVQKRKRDSLQKKQEATVEVSGALPEILLEEVAKHNSPDNAWLLIDGIVHDITEYYQSKKHPGGTAALDPFLGCDATHAFVQLGHSSSAKVLLGECAIGVLAGKARRPSPMVNVEGAIQEVLQRLDNECENWLNQEEERWQAIDEELREMANVETVRRESVDGELREMANVETARCETADGELRQQINREVMREEVLKKVLNLTNVVNAVKAPHFAAACALASFFAVKTALRPSHTKAKMSSKAPHFVACAELASFAVRIFGPKSSWQLKNNEF
jgi:cytochrome b involved in lipid metabolism